jgi:hypothetical protein
MQQESSQAETGGYVLPTGQADAYSSVRATDPNLGAETLNHSEP